MVSSDGSAADQAPILGNLLLRSLIQAQGADQVGLLRLVVQAAEKLSPCRIVGVLLDGAWQDVRRGGVGLSAADVARIGSTPEGGPIAVDGASWAWVYPMPIATDHLGFLVVAAGDEPGATDKRLLPALARRAGVAVANMRARLAEQARIAELRAESEDLRRRLEIRDRLAAELLRVGGQQGIARAVHELTGYPAWIEDAFGNVIAWAGAGPINSFPHGRQEHRAAWPPAARARPGGRRGPGGWRGSGGWRESGGWRGPKTVTAAGAVRDGDLLITMARLAGEPVGAIVLVDPGRTAGVAEHVAIEFAGTMLAMEVSRAQSLTQSRERARANLVLQLIGDGEESDVLSQALALGYDLGRIHRVLVLECTPKSADRMDVFFHGVSRAAQAVAVGSLIAVRPNDVILLADADAPWVSFHARVEAESPGLRCSIGVGGRCEKLADFPRSHRQAQLALQIQKSVGTNEKVTVFDELGVYKILATEADAAAMESFAKDWLGGLMSYDAMHGTELVRTLSEFLDSGGSYDTAATTLSVHRSTLKYRLKRIREVSGFDLSTPDTQFNLQVATRAWRTLQALRRP